MNDPACDILLDADMCEVYGKIPALMEHLEQSAPAVERGKDTECHLLGFASRHPEITGL